MMRFRGIMMPYKHTVVPRAACPVWNSSTPCLVSAASAKEVRKKKREELGWLLGNLEEISEWRVHDWMAGYMYHIGIRKYRRKTRLKNLWTTWVQQPYMQLEESGKRPGLEDLKLDVFSRRWSWVNHRRKGPVVLWPCLVVFIVSMSPSSFV